MAATRHIFARPIQYDGREYEYVDMDFEALTGTDMMSAADEVTTARPGDMITMLEFDARYQAVIARYAIAYAARAAGLPAPGPGFIEALPIREASQIRMQAQGFLLGTGSGDSPEPEEADEAPSLEAALKD